jgi:hypothetical protein
VRDWATVCGGGTLGASPLPSYFLPVVVVAGFPPPGVGVEPPDGSVVIVH